MTTKKRIKTLTPALVLLLASVACVCVPLPGIELPDLGQDDQQFTLSDNPQAELVYTASDYVWRLSSDRDGNLYVLTDGGDLLRIDAEGGSEKVYSDLALCSFSRRSMAVLPSGDLVVNDCADKTDRLLQIDQDGNATTLLELQDNVLSLSSDLDGNVYVGTWASEGNLNLNLQPFTYLGGADNITGQISRLSPDNTLTTIYEGGIPVALATGDDGDLVAAIWGESGPFRPERKEYSACSYLGMFWIGMSEQVKVVRIAGDDEVQIVTEAMNSVSAVTLRNVDRVVVVGMHDPDPCGIYLVETGQEPLRLAFSDDEVDDDIMGLTIAGEYLYFADVDGNVYRAQ
ncbi:MAG: hypothetical protein JW918_18935 [Anaerolineae bacterium]|nr:hypothetical protein [Anaerolineae bacterium]